LGLSPSAPCERPARRAFIAQAARPLRVENQTMKFGPLSVFFGLLALALAHAAEVFRYGAPLGGELLRWADRNGLVRSPRPEGIPEWSASGYLPVSDPMVLQWLLFHVMWFSAVSAAFAAFAEAKHEDTLYPSVGFVCGALALMPTSEWLSVAWLTIGGLGVVIWRHCRANSPAGRA